MRRSLVGIAVAIGFVLGPAAPAWAHGGASGPSSSSNYRSTLVQVSPPIPGVNIAVIDDGQLVVATNTTPTPVVILGSSGEPYLMVDSQGVWENLRSPSLYINHSSAPGLVYLPPGADPHAPPSWKQVCHCDTAVWHDHRVHWGASKPPPTVSAAPGRYHLIETWHIQARYGLTAITATGDVSWVPGPSPVPWLFLAALAALAVAPLGLIRRWRVPLATVLLGLVAVDASRAAGTLGGHWGSFVTQLGSIPTHGALPLLFWIGSLAMGWLALHGRLGAAYGAALIAIFVAIFDALPTLSVLWHSQVITAIPANLQRGLIAATLGISVGLLTSSFVLADRLDKLNVAAEKSAQAASEANDNELSPPA